MLEGGKGGMKEHDRHSLGKTWTGATATPLHSAACQWIQSLSGTSPEPPENLSPAARPLPEAASRGYEQTSWNFAFGIRRCLEKSNLFRQFHSAITSRPVQPHLPPSTRHDPCHDNTHSHSFALATRKRTTRRRHIASTPALEGIVECHILGAAGSRDLNQAAAKCYPRRHK
ncbi:hypothetical protein GE21DRAFT_1286026 [Neurospora crassa]|nr:hypothetical protein GE21DRAFT_1286026 [Neurospora crassa]